MGFRSKIKGRLKGVLGKPETAPSPSKFRSSISDDSGAGNLRGEDEDVPWYLKYEDNDGWESTDANPDDDDEQG